MTVLSRNAAITPNANASAVTIATVARLRPISVSMSRSAAPTKILPTFRPRYRTVDAAWYTDPSLAKPPHNVTCSCSRLSPTRPCTTACIGMSR